MASRYATTSCPPRSSPRWLATFVDATPRERFARRVSGAVRRVSSTPTCAAIAFSGSIRTTPSRRCAPLPLALDALRVALNATLFLGLVSFEAHYAIYPPGAGYRRHRDRFFDDDARVLSCVLYLNADWTAEQGGALRIYGEDGIERDILPIAGTLVCFRSERFDHEVLPSTRERLSLTGWFKRRGTQTA